jgi:hypothetical protein
MLCECPKNTVIGNRQFCTHDIDPNDTLWAELQRRGLGKKHLEDYAKFITLKAIVGDFDADKISPTPEIDQVWHVHLLDTKSYKAMCQRIAPRKFFHHSPANAWINDAAKAYRLEMMKTMWKHHFGDAQANPPGERRADYHGGFFITIQTMTGATHYFDCKARDSIRTIKWRYQQRQGMPVDAQRFIHGGRQLEDDRVLQDYGIQSGNTVHLIERVRA